MKQHCIAIKVGKMTFEAREPERKKASTRNLLKDLKVRPVAQLQSSAEAQRGGCFRFLLPISSSKDASVLKSKSKPQTPKSAPPNSRILCSDAIANPSAFRKRISPKSIPENSLKPEPKNPAKPKTPDLLRRCKQGETIARGRIIGMKTKQEPTFSFKSKGKYGSHSGSTPREPIMSQGWVNPSFQIKEAYQQLPVSPASNSTPPIKASISPEVPCASSVAPMSVCYAAGHVITGVHDRRKCRSRGILTIAGEKSNVLRDTALLTPPVADASIRWFSFPSETTNRSENGSSNSTIDANKYGPENSPLSHTSILRTPASDSSSSPFSVIVQRAEASSGTEALNHKGNAQYHYDNACGGDSIHVSSPSSNLNSWRIIPGFLGNNMMIMKSICDDKFGPEKTPLSQTSVLRTPTSNSSSSPFSCILQRAEATSELRVLTSHEGRGGCAYGNAFDISPCSNNILYNCNVVSAPYNTNPRRKDIISATDQALETMKLFPNGKNNAALLPNLSFKFGYPSRTLSSVNLNHSEFSRKDELLGTKKNDKSSPASGARVSWREGLLSRIFEMGDLDYIHLLSDDEDVDCSRDGQVSSKFDSLFVVGNTCSFEYPPSNKKKGDHKCESDAIAESISTEGGGLFSSGDSDWPIFYKNNLFEL
ncbi:hypothetical protein AXF42_Ash011162 [Apostasia shenzhenica]|uniref:Uncharacterized protein n=1 Tax=Apostasia shenzhenica TaxID=1088818 RepID=A0A2I0AKZ4_9ASPA|nr:hypothetical protein AXF42_Ash011162 [Apostasia shenzhenica]